MIYIPFPLTLSGHIPVCNAVKYDYPLRESVESFLPAVDEFLLLCPEKDEDGTADLCRALADEHEKVKVHYQDWWNPARGCLCLGDATSYLIEKCQGKFHVSVQADEVLHENHVTALRGIAENGSWPMVEFERLNFFGTFDMINVRRDRWPCSVLRMGRRDLYPNLCGHGDATHIGYIGADYREDKYPRLDARGFVSFWHYCYVRKPSAYVDKQAHMGNLYGLGEDPRILKWREKGRINWWEMCPKEEFIPTPGPHPQVMARWIAERRPLLESGIIE